MDHEPSIDDPETLQLTNERKDAGLSICCGLKTIEELGSLTIGKANGKRDGLLKMKICSGCGTPQKAIMLFGTQMISFDGTELKPVR